MALNTQTPVVGTIGLTAELIVILTMVMPAQRANSRFWRWPKPDVPKRLSSPDWSAKRLNSPERGPRGQEGAHGAAVPRCAHRR